MNQINEQSASSEQNNPGKDPIKKSRRKYIIGSLLIVFIIAGTIGVSIAKNKIEKFREHGPMGFLSDRIIRELNLNDYQKQQVEKMRDEIKAKMDEKKNSHKEDRDQMEQLFRSDNFDKLKALELMKSRDSERDEMRSFFMDQVAKFHAILTPDQRNKAADKMKEMRENRKKFFKERKDGQNKDGQK